MSPNFTLANGRNTPLNALQGTVPSLSGVLTDWFQAMSFTRVVKSTVGFQVIETPTVISFRGVIQPLSDRALQLKPEGQRAWTWFLLYSDPTLKLDVDEVVTYLGIQYRVMALKDYSIYGYMDYHICEDFTGAGP